MGAAIRDLNNKVIVVAVKSTQFIGDVKAVEVEAIEWGLVVVKGASLHCLIVETYCQDVVKLVNDKKGSSSEITWVISKIQNQNKDLQNISFHYNPRSWNAYTLS